MKTYYVAGFLFTEGNEHVALIRKAKPQWQAGKLNAIGGKIEYGETPSQAMVREFGEETGLRHTEWREFCVLEGPTSRVHFFVTVGPAHRLTSMETERIEIVRVATIRSEQTIENLQWLIPLALDKDHVVARVYDRKNRNIEPQPASAA